MSIKELLITCVFVVPAEAGSSQIKHPVRIPAFAGITNKPEVSSIDLLEEDLIGRALVETEYRQCGGIYKG